VKKKPVFGGIILAMILIIIIFGDIINSDNPEQIENDVIVFHVTLADPELYENGVYVDYFQVDKGTYKFVFVPNGDSPQKLSIKLVTESGGSIMDNDFKLEGNLIEDEISSWYTWEYLGKKKIGFDESKQIKIIVDPNGNYNGPVSIDLIKLK
jgi:hypothetical protein